MTRWHYITIAAGLVAVAAWIKRESLSRLASRLLGGTDGPRLPAGLAPKNAVILATVAAKPLPPPTATGYPPTVFTDFWANEIETSGTGFDYPSD